MVDLKTRSLSFYGSQSEGKRVQQGAAGIAERFPVDMSIKVVEASRALPVLAGGGAQETDTAPEVVASETVSGLGS